MAKRSGPIYRTPHEKFLRVAAEETERQARHSTKVRYTPAAGAYPENWRVVCSCTWSSAPYNSRELANDVMRLHREGAM